MKEKLKFILVGLGGFGYVWCTEVIPKLKDVVTLVAAVDINPDTFINPIQFCGLDEKKCYTDIKAAFSENPADFVVIVTPPGYREHIIDLALEYNCDIVSEKPFANDMETSVRIYRKVMNSGRKMLVTMNHRMDRDKQTLVSLLKSGEYGRLNYIIGRIAMAEWRISPLVFASGHGKGASGIINECAIHQLDTIRSLAGSNAKTVFARTVEPPWGANSSGFGADCVFINLLMENGVSAFLEMSFSNAATLNEWKKDYFRAECEKAELILDNRKIEVRSELEPSVGRAVSLLPGGDEKWAHCLLVRQFVSWVEGGPEPLCSIEDNMQCVAMVFAAVESCETGVPVDVQKFLNRYM